MNKRIQELADQILPNEKEFHQGDPKDWGYFFTGEELEKFAELLIKECVVMAKGFEFGVQREGLSEALKKHFGVEE